MTTIDNIVPNEKLSRCWSAILAGFSTFIAAVLICISFSVGDLATRLIVQGTAACALATMVVCGARALDGPILVAGRRQRREPMSAAAGAARMWIFVFVAIESAFFLTTVTGEVLEKAGLVAQSTAEKSPQQHVAPAAAS